MSLAGTWGAPWRAGLVQHHPSDRAPLLCCLCTSQSMEKILEVAISPQSFPRTLNSIRFRHTTGLGPLFLCRPSCLPQQLCSPLSQPPHAQGMLPALCLPRHPGVPFGG